MIIVELVKAHPLDTIALVVVAIIIIALIATGRTRAIRQAALYAVSVAEENWGGKTGEIKYAEAVTYIKTTFPVITFFFTEKQISHIIETAVTRMKEILTQKEAAEKKTAIKELK